ncbi:MAG: hypothetical protein D6677_13465 [Calditrichaeota bacterium]|nr:MAG: hypothetical protein D6677_13465 [Calditrichota bacterium]
MITKNKLSGFIVFALVLGLVSMTFAGDVDRIGTAAGTQLQQPVSARDIALSGANIAMTQGVDALYWNPAGLSRLKGNAIGQFSNVTIFNDISINYLAVGANMGDFGAIGFSIKAFDFGDIPLTTNQDMDGASGKTFSPTFATTALTYSLSLSDNIHVGATAKVVYESIPRAEGTAIAFDAGLQYDNFAGINGVSFGISIKNIGSDLKYAGSALTDEVQQDNGRQDVLTREAASNALPGSIEMGVGYTSNIDEQNSLTVMTMFQSNNFEYDALRLGAEYSFDNFIYLRGGYNLTAANSEEQLYTFSLGAGITYNVGGTDLTFDYAFRPVQYFNSDNIFSLSVAF